jgi:hypothetical protein
MVLVVRVVVTKKIHKSKLKVNEDVLEATRKEKNGKIDEGQV